MLGQWQWGLQRGWSDMRASDSDRDRAVAALREHCAAGRITIEELSERLDQALRARTMGELSVPLRDLPELGNRPSAPVRRRPSRRTAVLMVLVLVFIASRAALVAGQASAGAVLVTVILVTILVRMMLRASRIPRRW
jgi:Flp pilus assembly protein TadB